MSLAQSYQNSDASRFSPWWPPVLPDPKVAGELSADQALAEAVADGILVMRLSNYPTDENVAAAAAWRPEAEPILRRWKEIWDRSFDTAESCEFFQSHKNETPGEHYDVWYQGNAVRKAEALAKGDLAAAANCMFWDENRSKIAYPGQRDWRAHIIDDAETVCALAEAVPTDAWVSLGDKLIFLKGFDPDGLPRLEKYEPDPRHEALANILKRNRPNDDHPYWLSPAFLRHAGRPFRVVKDKQEISIVLLAMATEGQSKAFLKGVESKSGTWTVDLSKVKDPTDAVGALYRAIMPWDLPGKGVIVQEHVPFTHEQRFFVIGGRIVASVCSDRHFSAADKRGRILDERIAVLKKPEIDEGTYDRGVTVHVIDRGLAARFARGARALVKDLAAEGVFDYVVDMGLAADGRGVLPVELNSLYMSGPYCLDRTRIVRARNRLRASALSAIRSRYEKEVAFSSAGRQLGPDDISAVVDIAMEGIDGASKVVRKLMSLHREPLPRPLTGKTRVPTARLKIRESDFELGAERAVEKWRERRRSSFIPEADVVAFMSPGAGGPLGDAVFSVLGGTALFSLPVVDGAAKGRMCCSLVDVGDGGRALALGVGLVGIQSWLIGLVSEGGEKGRAVPPPEFVRRLRNHAAGRCDMLASGRSGRTPLFADSAGNVAWFEPGQDPYRNMLSVVFVRADGTELRHDYDLPESTSRLPAVGIRAPEDGSVGWKRDRLAFESMSPHSFENSTVLRTLAAMDYKARSSDEFIVDPFDEDFLLDSLGHGKVASTDFLGDLAPADEKDRPAAIEVPPEEMVAIAPGSGTKAETVCRAFFPDGIPAFSVPMEFDAEDRTGVSRHYELRLCGSLVNDVVEKHPPTIVATVAGSVSGNWYATALNFGNGFGDRIDPWLTGDPRLPADARGGTFAGGAFVLFAVEEKIMVSLLWKPEGRRGKVEVVLEQDGRKTGVLEFDPWTLHPTAEEDTPEVSGLLSNGEIDDGIFIVQ